MEEASEELVSTDKQVSSLKVKLTNAQQEINKLRNELNLARIKRNSSATNNLTSSNSDYFTNLKYALYALLTVWFFTKLISIKRTNKTQINPTWPT